MNFHSRYVLSETDKVLGIRRQVFNLLYFTANKIHFSRILDKRNAQSFCDAGTSTITDVFVDAQTPGTFYASTERGEILVFEAQNKADTIDCKIKVRLIPSEVQGKMKLASAGGLLVASTSSAGV